MSPAAAIKADDPWRNNPRFQSFLHTRTAEPDGSVGGVAKSSRLSRERGDAFEVADREGRSTDRIEDSRAICVNRRRESAHTDPPIIPILHYEIIDDEILRRN